MKTYVLMISKFFPATHPRAGYNTYFRNKILLTVNQPDEKFEINGNCYVLDRNKYDSETAFNAGWSPKIHTIRGNYDLWAKRTEKINRGEAVLSLRQWTGSPYNFKRDGSKQVEFMKLNKIHVQKFEIWNLSDNAGKVVRIDDRVRGYDTVAKNDGLSAVDFYNWFKKDMHGVVIHFTEFKY